MYNVLAIRKLEVFREHIIIPLLPILLLNVWKPCRGVSRYINQMHVALAPRLHSRKNMATPIDVLTVIIMPIYPLRPTVKHL